MEGTWCRRVAGAAECLLYDSEVPSLVSSGGAFASQWSLGWSRYDDVAALLRGLLMAGAGFVGRAMASDFDGTLFFGIGGRAHPLRRFLSRDLEAIEAFRAGGGLFGVCTGRPLGTVLADAGSSLSFDFAITSSGACVSDGVGNTLFSREIPDDDVRALLDSLGFGTQERAARFVVGVGELLGGRVSAFQNLDSVDVVPAGCSKGAGLSVARGRLGLGLVGGIGDSFNDLPLLDEADVAYTFNRAPEAVQEGADVLVDDVAGALVDLERR